ncbi:MAG: proton-conducting transporter membrane subunit, partial [Myxococcota bacterium]|nr:proton-conducting transporter membrane subunit [Myxococcota bacterium]
MSLVLIPILLPLFTALLIHILGRLASDNIRDGAHTLMAIVNFYFVCQIYPKVMSGEVVSAKVTDLFPGAPIYFEVEPLGMLFALVASGLWIPTSVYAFGYMRGHHEKNQTRFFTCFALAIGFAIGIAFSGNLITLFAFYEALTFSTFPLVTHHQDAAAKRSGRIYVGILVSTSVCLLLTGIIAVWGLTGEMGFKQGGILAGKVDDAWTVGMLLALFAFGTGKAALFPFHKWLPNAMVAPTPVSALLHAVAVVKAGVFTVLKVIVYIFGYDLLTQMDVNGWLMAVACFTMLFSSCVALTKDNLKARLAYSTISQLSYIVLGAAMANPIAWMGAALHIVMHAVGKITLFFCAGAIFVGAHKKYISQMDGLGHKMPWTMGAFTLASFSIIGLPPMGGVWSKWYLCLGALEAEHVIYLVAYMVSSLLSIGYLMPIVGRAYFRKPSKNDDSHVHEAPWMCVLPLCITAVGCVVLFFY